MDKTAVKNLFTLEDVLSELLASQKKLGALLERQRQALAKGDASALSDLCREEQAFIDQIRGLERRRLELVAALGQSFKRPSNSEKNTADAPLALRELAERVPEPVRTRLLVRRSELITVMTEVQRATAIVRGASETLLRHVGGLIGTLGSAAQGGAAYSPSGRTTSAPIRLSTINVSA